MADDLKPAVRRLPPSPQEPDPYVTHTTSQSPALDAAVVVPSNAEPALSAQGDARAATTRRGADEETARCDVGLVVAGDRRSPAPLDPEALLYALVGPACPRCLRPVYRKETPLAECAACGWCGPFSEAQAQGVKLTDAERLQRERDEARADVVRMAQTCVGELCEHHKLPLAMLEYHALRECPICWKLCAEELQRKLDALGAARRDPAPPDRYEPDRVERLLTAAKGVMAQFDAIAAHQERLLVTGQDLESASANWDDATLGLSIDFSDLKRAIEACEKVPVSPAQAPTP